ncbi:MAG: hypothetical protein ACE5IW_12690 [bacterium]
MKGRVTESANGIAVAITGITGEFQSPIKPAIISQKNTRWIPNILPILLSTTVDFPNDELVIYHDAFSVPIVATSTFRRDLMLCCEWRGMITLAAPMRLRVEFGWWSHFKKFCSNLSI